MPCGVWVSLPTGYWMACAAAVPAAPKAQPAESEASIICSRASIFLPSFTAVGRGGEALDGMGQRIGATNCGQAWRAGDGEFGIAHRHAGDQIGAGNAHLG